MNSAHGRQATVIADNLARRSRGTRSLVLLVIVYTIAGFSGSSSCSSPRPTPLPQNVSATKIVRQNAADAFLTHLDPADVEALRTFQDRIATARNRADLTEAWKNVPALLAKGPDFLERQVFSRAFEDGDWPPGQSPQQVDEAFVEGVRQATAEFIARGGR